MIRWLIKPARTLVEALADAASPHHLALGFALGMLVGVVPKDNLTSCALATLLLAIRTNLASAALGALLFTWIGVLADPVAHRLGLALLEYESLRPVWTWFFHLPLAPWTALNNSVVLGSLVLGLISFFPTYRLSRPFFGWAMPLLAEWIARWHIGKILLGVDAIASGGSR